MSSDRMKDVEHVDGRYSPRQSARGVEGDDLAMEVYFSTSNWRSVGRDGTCGYRSVFTREKCF